MIKIFFGILLFSIISNAQQSREEFVKSRLFGIVADESSLGLRAMADKLNAAIATRIESEPEATRSQLMNELADCILKHRGWVTTDKVSRAATNFVEILISESGSTALLERFQVSLRMINHIIESGWAGRKIEEAKLQRLQALATIHERIQTVLSELGGRRIASFVARCYVAYTGDFQPHL